MLALQLFLGLTAFTLSCYAMGALLQRRRTKKFQEYSAALAAQAKNKADLRAVS